jgi:TonB family protein
MHKIIKLSILFIIISIDLIGQTNSNEYTFKNSIMYHKGKKDCSYKANGEIIFFEGWSGKDRIESKIFITALDGNQIKIDTLNIDSLSHTIGQIKAGRMVNKKNNWRIKSATEFNDNGKKIKQLLFSDGQTYLYSSYDENEKPIEKGNKIIKDGELIKDGEWIKYNELGGIYRKENYINGVRNARTVFYADGKIKQVESNKNDEYTCTVFYKNGKIKLVETNKNDKYTRTNYYENEKIKNKTEMIKGKGGEEIEYNENGDVVNIRKIPSQSEALSNDGSIGTTTESVEMEQPPVNSKLRTNSVAINSNERPIDNSGQIEMPTFYGGDGGLKKYFSSSIKYPQDEKYAGISGTVEVSFEINELGDVQNARVVRGVKGGPGLDKEALRIINNMPKWKAGTKNGSPAVIQLTEKIVFRF